MNKIALHWAEQHLLPKIRLLFALLTCVGILCGCATVVNDSAQPVRVETLTTRGEAIRGADCRLANDRGMISVKSGETVQVHRSSADLQIDCSLTGQPSAVGRAVSRANAGLAGNIILGGVIGAAIDHSKGTGYTYPSWLQLVFGEARAFDRRFEIEGKPLRGTPLINPYAPSYASIDDLTRLPHSSSKMVERYQVFLRKPLPRAFAISEAGEWRMAWGDNPSDRTVPSDPAERAVYICERDTGKHCFLYAVDIRVVYQPPNSVSALAPVAKQQEAWVPERAEPKRQSDLQNNNGETRPRIALLQIRESKFITVANNGGAPAILGALGGAVGGGVGGGIQGSINSENSKRFLQVLNDRGIKMARPLASSLQEALRSKGFDVIYLENEGPKLASDGKTSDYSHIETDADAILNVWFGTTGYWSGAFSSAYEPWSIVRVRLLDAHTKKELYFRAFSIGRKRNEDQFEFIPVADKYKYETADKLFENFDEAITPILDGHKTAANLIAQRISALAYHLNGETTQRKGSTDNQSDVANTSEEQAIARSQQASSQMRVPFVNDAGQKKYLEYLDKPLPRAFAIADNGHWGYASGENPKNQTLPRDPKERALMLCNKAAGKECRLYSVDNEVMFHE